MDQLLREGVLLYVIHIRPCKQRIAITKDNQVPHNNISRGRDEENQSETKRGLLMSLIQARRRIYEFRAREYNRN